MNDARPSWRKRLWRSLLTVIGLSAVAFFAYRYYAERTRLVRLSQEYDAAVKLRQRFEQQVTLNDYDTRTVRELMLDFKSATNIAVSWGEEGYEMQRWIDRPLGCTLPPLAAHEWLDAVAALRGFTWEATADGAVNINAQSADAPRYWQHYPLPITPAIGCEELYYLLTSHVEPDAWEDVGGPWAMQTTPAGLTTFQSLRGHLRSQRFLSTLTQACETAAARAPLLAIDPTAGEPIWLEGEQQHFRESQRALETPITLRVVDMPYIEFVGKLSEKVRFPIIAHPRQLYGREGRQPVNCNLRDVPLRNVLREAELNDLSFGIASPANLLVIFDDLPNVTSPQPRTYCAYPVADLTRGDCDPLIDLITSTLSPDAWQDVGGPGAIDAISHADVLLMSQSVEVHTQIQELLTQLRQVVHGTQRHVALTPYRPRPTISAEVQTLLAKPLKVELQGIHNGEALRRVNQLGKIRIPGAVSYESSPSHHIWCHLPSRPLRENLELLYAACDLDRQYLEQVTELHDTSYYDESTLEVCEVFDLRPWMVTRDTSLSVVDLLTGVVDTDNWQDVGGNGSCRQFDSALIVNAHPDTVARVRLFLQVLEEYTSSGRQQWRGKKLAGDMLNQPLDLYGPTDGENLRKAWFAERNAAVREQLKQTATVKFSNKPRAEALYAVALKYDVPLVLRAEIFGPHSQGLVPCTGGDPLDITSHDLVSLDVQDQPLADVLQQLIGDPQKQQICVTKASVQIGRTGQTKEPLSEYLLYCVEDLIVPRGPYFPKQLIRTLEHGLKEGRSQKAFPVADPNRPFDEGMSFQFRFGNLLQFYKVDNLNLRQSQDFFERLLREVRSGERKALPAEAGDSNFTNPTYPPGFRPFVPNVVIPEVE